MRTWADEVEDQRRERDREQRRLIECQHGALRRRCEICKSDARIAELEAALVRINEKAVQLRDEIGTGSAVAELRGRVHNIVELSRKFMATK